MMAPGELRDHWADYVRDAFCSLGEGTTHHLERNDLDELSLGAGVCYIVKETGEAVAVIASDLELETSGDLEELAIVRTRNALRCLGQLFEIGLHNGPWGNQKGAAYLS